MFVCCLFGSVVQQEVVYTTQNIAPNEAHQAAKKGKKGRAMEEAEREQSKGEREGGYGQAESKPGYNATHIAFSRTPTYLPSALHTYRIVQYSSSIQGGAL